MSDTYTQLYIQVIFAAQFRNALISEKWEDKLYAYIGGTLNEMGHKTLAVNGMPDHIHFFLGLKPSIAISDMVREIKKTSNTFLRENIGVKKFQWQEGYGAFSYSRSQIDDVCKYIQNQKIHHKMKSFREEYIGFLEKFDIDYQEQYLFEWM